MRAFLTVAVVVACAVFATARQHALSPVLSASRGLADWDIEGSGKWRVAANTLVLYEAGVPAGPIRKPAAMAILKSAPIGDFTLEVDVKSTAPADLAVRDVLLIFGYQSPTRFYYVHLSARTDAVHNGIFLVHDADRRRLDPPTSRAPLTDQAFHRVRLERETATGRIEVFFDNDPQPVLSTTDRTLIEGRVGVGSFDETAEFGQIGVKSAR
jgi:hypothetical protein